MGLRVSTKLFPARQLDGLNGPDTTLGKPREVVNWAMNLFHSSVICLAPVLGSRFLVAASKALQAFSIAALGAGLRPTAEVIWSPNRYGGSKVMVKVSASCTVILALSQGSRVGTGTRSSCSTLSQNWKSLGVMAVPSLHLASLRMLKVTLLRTTLPLASLTIL